MHFVILTMFLAHFTIQKHNYLDKKLLHKLKKQMNENHLIQRKINV